MKKQADICKMCSRMTKNARNLLSLNGEEVVLCIHQVFHDHTYYDPEAVPVECEYYLEHVIMGQEKKDELL